MPAVQQAYGNDGLGIIAVLNVPDLPELRKKALAQSWRLGNLSQETLAKYEVPPFYQRGWSCGQEKMKDGTPDFNKGSFYFNPLVDSFPEVTADAIEAYPTFYGTNIWPQEELGPEFETDIKSCARKMIDVAVLIAKHCDAYLSKNLENPPHSIEKILKESKHPAARLLHYFALKQDKEAMSSIEDGWCGWHNDHGTITALLPAMFQEASTGKEMANPEPDSAGLYIKTRSGNVVKAKPPAGALLLQIGECAQVHSGGLLKATPHMVRSVSCKGVARSTLAVFTEPGHSYPMSIPKQQDVDYALKCEHLPVGVPELKTRWHEGINFGDFGTNTVKAYYKA